ncbi:hypothetical protein GCM10014713_02230 [Streptomyces purpureus]|uniref:Uncharacterized protein n=1 Tax=Streptomyces purpureus TaxID=1951 RepID=A0A918GX12_9ACTN|nr:hypothetical protein GCM10014713_02230 [Streptomyces purpureus]
MSPPPVMGPPLVAVAAGAMSPRAAMAVAATARARAARIVEPPVKGAPKRCSGKFDEYASHDAPSQDGMKLACRRSATPVRRHAGAGLPNLTDPQVTPHQNAYMVMTRMDHPAVTRPRPCARPERGRPLPRHPFAPP